MQIYEVGGAIRDALLGEPVEERDWVVVGATESALIDLGYRRVGKEFPVFLHPDTSEEYALARRERKTGRGYTGFEFDTAADISLEEDLARRDLTINAIARDASGALVDPYGGRSDLEQRVLRHVSPAFAEDPLRVLRVARFVARLAHYGFTVAPQTLQLMAHIAASGELDALTPERVWIETRKALMTAAPQRYFEVLRDCGALGHVYPEIDRLFGVPQPAEWHPEIDTGVHTMMTLKIAASLNASLPARFAALTHDLGKGTTPRSEWPRHRGHGKRSAALIEAMSRRLRVPSRVEQIACLVALYHGDVHGSLKRTAAQLHRLLCDLDAYRRGERVDDILIACEADARGRAGLEETPYPQAERIREALAASANVSARELSASGLQGPELGAALDQLRIARITRLLGH